MSADSMAVEIDATQLAMLLDGIDYGRVRRPASWEPRKKIDEHRVP
jgi:transposase